MARNHILFPLLALIPLAMSACSSTPTEDALDREQALHERMLERNEEMAKAQIKQSQEQIASLPDFVITKPRPDNSGLYGVGIGESRDLTQALRKSHLQARYDVAKEVNQTLSAEETMAGGADSEYRSIINAFVDQVDMAGLEDIAREIQPTATGFRVFTLVKLPFEQFNQARSHFGQSEELDAKYERLMARVQDREPYNPAPAKAGNVDALTVDPDTSPDDALVQALQQQTQAQ